MAVPIYQVDAFVTEKPFSGNPAAVCLLPKPADEAWMQNVAMEMNFSETAFVVKRSDGYDLRWFTPTVEVDLCGHATLASAHVLWEEGHLKTNEQARFHTKSGILGAFLKGEWIELDFPATPERPSPLPDNLVKALGVTPRYSGKNIFDYVLELDSEDIVKNLKPDFELLKTIPMRGVIVTSRSSSQEFDFVSRFFGPGSGVAEDPATGSSHCCLGPFWQARLGKKELIAYQASSRGGILRVRVGDGRVYVGGKAVTVLHGQLR